MNQQQLRDEHTHRLAELKAMLNPRSTFEANTSAERHCIVTPDIIGPINNGGIGTACYYLARFLRESGSDVDILFTGPCEIQTTAHWKQHYRTNYGIGFYAISDYPHLPYQPIHEGRWFIQRSLSIHNWLKSRFYNQIHFQEWQANGFAAMQARRVTRTYSNTLLTVCLHSSSEWQREGMRQHIQSPVEDSILDYCERYSVEHADVAIFPSQHMLNWANSHKWSLPRDHRVIPYHIDVPATHFQPVNKLDELCFFGRLETRKGLEIFIEAMKSVAKTHRLPKILFLGKIGSTSWGPADAYISQALAPLNAQYEIITSMSASQCLEFLKERKETVVVIPSLLDNLPYTVYECIAHGIPVIASRTGGIPEMIQDNDHLFDPTTRSLANCILSIYAHGLKPLQASQLPMKAKTLWNTLRSQHPKLDMGTPPSSVRVTARDITICIAHFNYGNYLPHLLSSLKKQTSTGFKVVVVDDGSTDVHSRSKFEELKRSFSSDEWLFISKENEGIGRTRNHAASHARTDYLLFMDADNIAEPNMVERFAHGMTIFDGDVLTCYMRAFANSEDGSTNEIVYSYAPPGPCLEAGHKVNVFGDANCIIKRSTFEAVNGFNEDRSSSFEDWELLAKIALRGYKVDVIPEHLFLYRHTAEGFSRNTSPYLNHKRVLNTYTSALPDWAARCITASFSSLRH
jgi:glycosyltransferase involved in cell wall biosynthesis/GT2 family glycosyltransferase